MSRPTFVPLRALAALSLFMLTSCATFRDGPGATSATVSARSGMDVEEAVGAVFTSHGYTQKSSDKGTIVFEKPGSHTDVMLYGDFDDNKMTDRVRVTIDPVDGGHFRITCVGYAVREATGHFAGDTSMEDPIRRLQLFSTQFSHMLDEVKARVH